MHEGITGKTKENVKFPKKKKKFEIEILSLNILFVVPVTEDYFV